MNRGVLQRSSAVQQMMAGGGSPNWWNINNMRPPSPPSQPPPPPPSSFLPTSPPNFFPHYTQPPPTTSSTASLLPSSSWNDNQELPESWGQLLLGGLVGEEEDKCGVSDMQVKKMEKWEEHVLHQSTPPPPTSSSTTVDVDVDDGVKHEITSLNCSNYIMYTTTTTDHHGDMELQAKAKAPWSQVMPVSSPTSCVTTLSSNILDISTKSQPRHPPPDHSSECNSTATGGVAKKARVHPPSTQSTFKVRKEKLGDRITALHQIVSPFGKTDTASVLLEAIGYIRFLQSQIEALSLPYLGSGSGNLRPQQQQQQQPPPVQGDRNCLFPEDPGQVSHEAAKKDLRSRGLCLVPISCTLQVGSENGADYWAPAAFNGGFQ